MTIEPKVLYRYNDQFIVAEGLTDGLTGAYQNTATVTATLYDRSGEVVPPINNLDCAYVAGSNGVYRGHVEDTFNAPAGNYYKLEIRAVVGGVTRGRWRRDCHVQDRKE